MSIKVEEVHLEQYTTRIPEMEWIESSREWLINEKPLSIETVIFPINDNGREKHWRWSAESIKKDYSQFMARVHRGRLRRFIINTEREQKELLLLNVRSASGDETVPVNVDLLETFNYLLGLKVEHIAAPIYFDAELSQSEFGRWQAKVKRSDTGQLWFRTLYGENPNGLQVFVVWRNLSSVIAAKEDGVLDNAVLDVVLVERLKIRLTESLDDEIDILYVNGEHNIHIPRDRQGQPMEQARVQLIEEAFQYLMFADTEAVH